MRVIATCMLAAMLLAVGSTRRHQDDKMCQLVYDQNADFGFALYKELNAKSDAKKNIFFSPLGISTALSMLAKGARGDTHSQLFSTLGYSNFDQSVVDSAYKQLFHMIIDPRRRRNMELGNLAAIQQSFNPLKSYISGIKKYYYADVMDVDFTKPMVAAEKINKYIAKNTGDLIKDQVKDLDPETPMMLVNYVHFRGQWEKTFNSSLTQRMDFYVDDSTKVQVDMMKRTGLYEYYDDKQNHAAIIKLLNKHNTFMLIILPNIGKMKDVEDSISKEQVLHWQNSLSNQDVDLMLPKFSISADASLADVLQKMGVINAFTDAADLSGISLQPRLKVSKVSHSAVLNVDETGTTAAASTTIESLPKSMPTPMKMDRPFLVLIVHEITKNILFMGRIKNPSGDGIPRIFQRYRFSRRRSHRCKKARKTWYRRG